MKNTTLILCLVLTVLFGFPMTAEAYIDPSVTSYALQAVAGVIIALGVIFGVVWRRIKKGTAKVLKIDENSNKEVEEDVCLTDESADK